jgi:hypothetical protein
MFNMFQESNDVSKEEIANKIQNMCNRQLDVIIDARRYTKNTDAISRYERLNNPRNDIYHINNIIDFNDNMNDNSIFPILSLLSNMHPTLSLRLRNLYYNENPFGNLEDVPTPLRDEHKECLEKIKFSSITPEKIGRSEIDTDCAICQSAFEPTNDVIILPCSGNHYFHDTCIYPWLELSKKCPVCRENIEDTINNKN